MVSGKEFEEAFDRGQAAYLQDFFRVSQPNLSWIVAQVKGANFAPSQLPDRILLSRRLGCWCFELKMCQGKTFPFSRLAEHQGKHLEEFAEKAGKAFVLIAFEAGKHVFAIPIAAYRFLERTGERKSINENDIWNAIVSPHKDFPKDFPIKEIPVEVPKTQVRLNLSVLVTKDMRDFFKKKE